jgi:hypothetical protein
MFILHCGNSTVEICTGNSTVEIPSCKWCMPFTTKIGILLSLIAALDAKVLTTKVHQIIETLGK